MVLVTFLLFIATVGLFWATKGLVSGAEKMSKQQLRAYLCWTAFASAPNSVNDQIKEYVFWADLGNLGLTPATDIRAEISTQVFAVSEEKDPLFIMDPNLSGGAALGPGASGKSGYITLPLATMIDLWEKKNKVFIWCRVEYRDVFNLETIRHHELCAKVELIRDPQHPVPHDHVPIVIFSPYGLKNTMR